MSKIVLVQEGSTPTTPAATKWQVYAKADGLYYMGSDSVEHSADIDTLKPLMPNRNVLINGAMDVWQRGTSFTLTTSAYLADRWQGYRNTTDGACSRQLTNDATNLPFINYCARISRNVGTTATNVLGFNYSAESFDAIRFAGKAATFSFYARAGSNYSSASSGLQVYLRTGTGTDENIVTGYTGSTSLINGEMKTLTTTWQRFTNTVTFPSTAKEFGLSFNFTPVGTAGANDYFEITGVQLELGSVATPFEFRPYAQELALCQRYYFRQTSTGSFDAILSGRADATNAAQFILRYPVQMRYIPTLGYSAITDFAVGYVSSDTTSTNIVLSLGSINACRIGCATSSVLTIGHAVDLYFKAGTGYYIELKAEL